MKRLKLAASALAATLVVVGGLASAQEEQTPPANPEGDAPPAATKSTFDSEAPTANLPSEEKLVAAQKKIERMRGTLGQTTDLLQQVREGDGDILRINCINEKLAAMKGFVKVSEQSYTSLRDAAARDDSAAETHHFSLITISDEKVRDLGEEAQICVGEVQMFVDEAVVDRREDPGIADVDPIEPDDDYFWDEFATETLPELTPFQ